MKLQLNLELNKWEISDYSKRTRSWIGKFIYNHYCKDTLDDKIKGSIYRTIMWEFWIKHQMWSDKISIPLNMALWFHKEEYIRKEEWLNFVKGMEELNNVSSLINGSNLELLTNPHLLKLVSVIFKLWVKNTNNSNELLVKEEDILDFLELYPIALWQNVRLRLRFEIQTLIFSWF